MRAGVPVSDDSSGKICNTRHTMTATASLLDDYMVVRMTGLLKHYAVDIDRRTLANNIIGECHRTGRGGEREDMSQNN